MNFDSLLKKKNRLRLSSFLQMATVLLILLTFSCSEETTEPIQTSCPKIWFTSNDSFSVSGGELILSKTSVLQIGSCKVPFSIKIHDITLTGDVGAYFEISFLQSANALASFRMEITNTLPRVSYSIFTEQVKAGPIYADANSNTVDTLLFKTDISSGTSLISNQGSLSTGEYMPDGLWLITIHSGNLNGGSVTVRIDGVLIGGSSSLKSDDFACNSVTIQNY